METASAMESRWKQMAQGATWEETHERKLSPKEEGAQETAPSHPKKYSKPQLSEPTIMGAVLAGLIASFICRR